MQTAEPPPLPGPIILAKVGKPQTKKSDELQENAANENITVAEDQHLGVIVFLSIMTCFGFVVAALIHQQWAGLLWLLAGGMPWLILFSLFAWDTRRSRNARVRQSDAPPDEQTLVIVDRLREYTNTGVLGEPVAATGVTGWLTHDGMYLSNGKLLPWQRFACFSLQSSESAYRVRFRRRFLPTIRSGVGGLLVFLWLLAGCGVQIFGSVTVWNQYGSRDDVLALLLGAFLHFCGIAYLAIRFACDLMGIGPNSQRSDIVALVNPKAINEMMVSGLLQEHLRRMKSER